MGPSLSLWERCFWRNTGMVAIGVILLFVIALGALNAYEFGRID